MIEINLHRSGNSLQGANPQGSAAVVGAPAITGFSGTFGQGFEASDNIYAFVFNELGEFSLGTLIRSAS